MKSQYLFLKCCIECDSLWIPCKIKWGKPCRWGLNEYTLIMLWILPALYLGQSVSTLGKQLSYEWGICFVNSIPDFPIPNSHLVTECKCSQPQILYTIAGLECDLKWHTALCVDSDKPWLRHSKRNQTWCWKNPKANSVEWGENKCMLIACERKQWVTLHF